MKKIILLAMIVFAVCFAIAENVDPYAAGEKYGWSENTGWLNADPSVGSGMQMSDYKVTGWVWGESIGWINLSCENNGTCGSVDFGVVNDGGILKGYAWGENVGWINFDPTVLGETRINEYCVRIDGNGLLDGWAWGENIGWIRFDKNKAWKVRVCVVTLEDLTNFAAYWLGTEPAANLDGLGNVDMGDFSILSSYWQDYCPDGWTLK